jgi:hypothetical protein
MSDRLTDLSGDAPWLVDPEHPALASPAAEGINDPGRPDRLAWNAFRTLAAWNTDVWVPSLLETAISSVNSLSGAEWSDAEVALWRSTPSAGDAVDVTIEGPQCIVVVEATLTPVVDFDRFIQGIDRAQSEGAAVGKLSGFVALTPELDEALLARLADLAAADLEGGGPSGVAGWITWREVGRLALDLAEEADPMRAEEVHRLVTQLQATFPGIEV